MSAARPSAWSRTERTSIWMSYDFARWSRSSVAALIPSASLVAWRNWSHSASITDLARSQASARMSWSSASSAGSASNASRSQRVSTLRVAASLPDGPGNRWRERVADLPVGYCLAASELPSIREVQQTGDHSGGQLRLPFQLIAEGRRMPRDARTRTAPRLRARVAQPAPSSPSIAGRSCSHVWRTARITASPYQGRSSWPFSGGVRST